MTLPTHIIAGLVVGAVSGDYSIAIIGSIVPDVDHLVPYAKRGILLKPRYLWKALTVEEDLEGDPRVFLHNILLPLILLLFSVVVDVTLLSIFSLAYLLHLVLDGLDESPYRPLYPFFSFELRGVIGYYSLQEFWFSVGLLIIFLLVWLN